MELGITAEIVLPCTYPLNWYLRTEPIEYSLLVVCRTIRRRVRDVEISKVRT